MLEKRKWDHILMAYLHTSDLFGSFELDQISDLTAWYYAKGFPPREAAESLMGAKILFKALRKGIECPDDAA